MKTAVLGLVQLSVSLDMIRGALNIKLECYLLSRESNTFDADCNTYRRWVGVAISFFFFFSHFVCHQSKQM